MAFITFMGASIIARVCKTREEEEEEEEEEENTITISLKCIMIA